MKNKSLHNAIEKVREIGMTAEEKKRILGSIMTAPAKVPVPVKSPWLVFFSASFRHKQKARALAVFLIAILVFGSASMVSASGESLPGDILYPLKVNVVEPMHAFLKSSPRAKAEYETTLAVRRLKEAEKLTEEGRLDESKEKKLNDLLASHTVTFDKNLKEVRKRDSQGTEELATNFQAEMKAHARVIEHTDSRNTRTGDTRTKIWAKARESAGEIRNTAAAIEEKSSDAGGEYAKKKQAIESLINETAKSIQDRKSNSSAQASLEETHEVLDQARQYLEEAEDEDRKGNKREAYSKLLDSESSVKESSIFFDTEIKTKNKKNFEKEDAKKERKGEIVRSGRW